MSAVDFVQEIPADKKYLLELKFNVYICTHTDENAERAAWQAIIVDNKHKRTVLKDVVTDTSDRNRAELVAVITTLNFLAEKFDEKTREYLCVDLFTDSLYTSNILNEWLVKWWPTKFDNRPNADLLLELYDIVVEYDKNLRTIYSPPNSMEFLAICRKELSE